MSGIYIPGMEMPDTCITCPLQFGGMCYVQPAEIDEPRVAPTVDTCVARADWCPLVEIPDHGRLIDADALRASIKESIDECHKWAKEVSEGEMYARVSQSLGTFVECSLRIKAAPTIIPADKDGA